jgi:hypothetical protein
MSDAIPDRFVPAVRAVEAVLERFDAGQEFRPEGPGRWIREVGMEWADGISHVAFVLDIDDEVLGFYVMLRHAGNGPAAADLVEATARANYGLSPGAFEIDVDTGEIRHRSTLALICDIDAVRVAQLISNALRVTRQYRHAFEKVAAGGDPRAAIEAVET